MPTTLTCLGPSSPPACFELGRRLAWLSAVLPVLLACTGEPSAPAAATGSARPPIVLISIDTLRADRLPAYGYDGVETPAIDRLRRDAILFRNAYTTNPTTLPAHASLLTGLPPTAHGVRDNVGYRLDAGRFPTLARRLAAAGYATGAAVSAYVLRGQTGLGAGFDLYDDGIEVTAQGNLSTLQRPGEATAAAALRWVEAQRGEPFFFFLHLFEPHAPYQPPEPFAGRYADPYDGEIAAADAIVGRLLDRLRRSGLYDPAVILLLADHGEGLGDHGEEEHGVLLYRETLRVPLLLKLPGSRRAGSTVEEAAQLLDVVPTLLELAGVPGAADLAGSSLLGLAAAAPAEPRRRIYGETYYPRLHLGWSELTSLVTDRHHFIDGPEPELFDLVADPGEIENVLDRHRPLARSMRSALEVLATEPAAPEAVDPVDAARLRALGYLTTTVASGEDLPDPRRALPALRRVRSAYELAASGSHREAAAILERLVERYPGMIDARFQLCASLRVLGREEEALEHYRRGIETAPTAADGILIEMARIFARRGELEPAEEHARAALEAMPAEALEILAQIALARGDAEAAFTLARQAVSAERLPRADSLLLLARLHLQHGEHEAALAVLEPLRARVEGGSRPPVPELELERGEALARLGRYEEATTALRAEIREFPRQARAYANLAFVYASSRQSERIDPLLEAMVAARPEREVFLLAATTVERLGNAEEARRWRRRAEGAGGAE